jgi:hypothetical protein
MPNDIKDQIEKMIDERGLPAIINILADICFEKAEHVETNYNDKVTAKAWTRYGDRCSALAVNLSTEKKPKPTVKKAAKKKRAYGYNNEVRYKLLQLQKQLLTPEEKARWEPILRQTWSAIANDTEEAVINELDGWDVIELTCDANHPMNYGMTREEYEFLLVIYNRPAGKRWLKEVLFDYA